MTFGGCDGDLGVFEELERFLFAVSRDSAEVIQCFSAAIYGSVCLLLAGIETSDSVRLRWGW